MDFKGIGSLSRGQRVFLFLALGLVAFFIPGLIDEVVLALWGIAQLIGAGKAARVAAEPKEKKTD